MPKHKPKNQPTSIFKRLATSKLAIIGEIGLLVMLGFALGKEVIRKYQIENEIRQLEQEVTALENRNTELSSMIDYFDSDTYKEEQARLKLGMQKPGERVVAVLGVQTNTDFAPDGSVSQVRSTGQEDPRANPQRWWDYFFST